jgi:hypothetical protein
MTKIEDELDPSDSATLRQVEDLMQAPVPDPGPLYWAAFQGRVQDRLANRPATRRWVPWTGMAVAATLMTFMWMGGRMLDSDPATSLPGEPAITVLDTWDGDNLDGTLDLALGLNPATNLGGDLDHLSPEEKQVLLESLRTELMESSPTAPAGPGPASTRRERRFHDVDKA